MITVLSKLFGRALSESNKTGNVLHQQSGGVKNLAYITWYASDNKIELSEGAFDFLGFQINRNLSLLDIKKLCHPADINHISDSIDNILITKSFPDSYCRVITAKNEEKHIFITGEIIIDSSSKISVIKALLQDVTEQRLHIQKIQLQNQRLQDIAWLQSHKMRSPVATIMGLIQLFNANDPNDPINIKVLEGVKEAAGNLDEVIKEINSKTETTKVLS